MSVIKSEIYNKKIKQYRNEYNKSKKALEQLQKLGYNENGDKFLKSKKEKIIEYEKKYSNRLTKEFTLRVLNSENEKEIETITNIKYKHDNVILHAPTQVGKTNSVIEILNICIDQKIPALISTDNKNDQLDQIYSRVDDRMYGVANLLRVLDPNFKKNICNYIENGELNFIIFCLDKSSQLEKLIDTFQTIMCTDRLKVKFLEYVKKFVILQDEADVSIRDCHNYINNEIDQPESHKCWIRLFDLFKNTICNIELKRFFITATPESCCLLYNVESAFVCQLPIPEDYRGYDHMEFVEIEKDKMVGRYVIDEYNRIVREESNEVILVCINNKKIEHEKFFEKTRKHIYTGICNIYNGDGIKSFIPDEYVEKFESVLRDNKVPYKISEKNIYLFKISKVPIRNFYKYCQLAGSHCVITIGKLLISRGISYVADMKEKPLTATVMIFLPGETMTQVAANQIAGRITGIAQPDLKRRLYTTKEIIKNYKAYNINQKKYMEHFKNNANEKLTKNLILEIPLVKSSRAIDKKGKMSLNKSVIFENIDDVPGVKIDGVDIRKLQGWLREDDQTVMGKIVKLVKKYEGQPNIFEKIRVDMGYETDTLRNNLRGMRCTHTS